MYTQVIHGINVESFSNCYASSYFNFKVTHWLIPPSPLTQFILVHFRLPGCTGLQSCSSFTVVYFTDTFTATDRQLKSAEHTLAARQQAAAP